MCNRFENVAESYLSCYDDFPSDVMSLEEHGRNRPAIELFRDMGALAWPGRY